MILMKTGPKSNVSANDVCFTGHLNWHSVASSKLSRNKLSRTKYSSLTFSLYINYFNSTNMYT